MKGAMSIVLVMASVAPLLRETNSHAAAERARDAFADKKYAAAAEAYGRAQELEPSMLGAFNLGTAQIAAGAREEGAATLAKALEDPTLAADAYFNRGNGALAANALDHAVVEYVQALKANPAHAAAKRNLEIALHRRASQQREGARQQQQQQGQQQNQQRQPAPGEGQPGSGPLDLEALLRSVQQQEQEELRRMKGQAGEARVGW